ncbi:MAG: D-amino-acid transaminase [Pseudomonadota bacterium]
MARIAYVNGEYRPVTTASIAVEDRGLQFADGVYEVWAVRDGRLMDWAGHVERLRRSLGELRIAPPCALSALPVIIGELIRRNRIVDGLVYLQVTRGVAPRNHAFPDPAVKPTLILTARPVNVAAMERRAQSGAAVITRPDLRWKRCDIKSISLLPNILAKQEAAEAGAVEAWLVDEEGCVTEGASSNAWIVTTEGVLITRAADSLILRGITRQAVARLAQSLQLKLEERSFTVDEAKAAQEAFITSASSFVMPVVAIDGEPVGSGSPGPVASRLRQAYSEAG